MIDRDGTAASLRRRGPGAGPAVGRTRRDRDGPGTSGPGCRAGGRRRDIGGVAGAGVAERAGGLVEGATDHLLGRVQATWPDPPEWVAMLIDILKGSQLGPGDGWFKKAVAQTRYDWADARRRLDRDRDGRIDRGEFPGADADFARLDRDRDGALTERDFDFSAHALDALAGRDGLLRGRSRRQRQGDPRGARRPVPRGRFRRRRVPVAGRPPGGADAAVAGPRVLGLAGPSRLTLVKGLFRQEIGSLQPGPAVGTPAPDFTLKTVDGKEEITLSKLVGPKPVVLVFGNFTCGPFRSQAGNVEKLYRRYKDRATFVMVYVREAHPTDGWRMESNDRRRGLDRPAPERRRAHPGRPDVQQAARAGHAHAGGHHRRHRRRPVQRDAQPALPARPPRPGRVQERPRAVRVQAGRAGALAGPPAPGRVPRAEGQGFRRRRPAPARAGRRTSRRPPRRRGIGRRRGPPTLIDRGILDEDRRHGRHGRGRGIGSGKGLARRLGLATATAMVVGEVIGVGIFLTPAGMAKSLGSPAWLIAVWLIMGASAIGGALTFGGLAARYPEAGGIYVYLREAYGPRVGFLYGWLSMLVTDPGLTAFLGVGLANYAAHLVPLSDWGLKAVAVAAIVVLAAVNMLGASIGSGVLRALAGLKIGLLVFLVIWGFGSGTRRLVEPRRRSGRSGRARRRCRRPWPSA